MDTLLRNTPPVVRPVESVHFQQPEIQTMDNGTKLYLNNSGEQDIVRIEAVFPAGRAYEKTPGIAGATTRLMKDGTSSMTAAEISEQIEQHGAAVKFSAGFDLATLSIHSLTRHLDRLLPVVEDILQNSIFPQQELETYLSTTRQKLRIEEERNDYLADVGMRESLYGNNHPYGYRTSSEVLNNINREQLVEHYQRCYSNSQPVLFAAGKISADTIAFIEALFGSRSATLPETPGFQAQPTSEQKDYRVKKGSVQSAIRVFRPIISKSHEDYPAFMVLNTVLGGFFGSRLMSNIREDKGYTYGIYSGMGNFDQESYLYITSEVGVDVCKAALKEVKAELSRLCNQPIPADELELVRSYMLGSILGSVDGPLKTGDTVKSLVTSGLKLDHIQHLVHTIRDVKSVELQELANKYLQPDSMRELVVGYPES